jgi:hypothetical protein
MAEQDNRVIIRLRPEELKAVDELVKKGLNKSEALRVVLGKGLYAVEEEKPQGTTEEPVVEKEQDSEEKVELPKVELPEVPPKKLEEVTSAVLYDTFLEKKKNEVIRGMVKPKSEEQSFFEEIGKKFLIETLLEAKQFKSATLAEMERLRKELEEMKKREEELLENKELNQQIIAMIKDGFDKIAPVITERLMGSPSQQIVKKGAEKAVETATEAVEIDTSALEKM